MRITGRVVSYNTEKGAGVLHTDSYGDVTFDKTVLQQYCSLDAVPAGSELEVQVAASEDRHHLIVDEIFSASAPAPSEKCRQRGVICDYLKHRNYGYIRSDYGGSLFFLDAEVLKAALINIEEVELGKTRVYFATDAGRRGEEVSEICLAGVREGEKVRGKISCVTAPQTCRRPPVRKGGASSPTSRQVMRDQKHSLRVRQN